MIVIDARELLPPEPFERVMEAMANLAEGEEILLILNREPYPLYRVLDQNGYRHDAESFPDGRFEIRIARRARTDHG